jgi:hypothetical protein
MIKD